MSNWALALIRLHVAVSAWARVVGLLNTFHNNHVVPCLRLHTGCLLVVDRGACVACKFAVSLKASAAQNRTTLLRIRIPTSYSLSHTPRPSPLPTSCCATHRGRCRRILFCSGTPTPGPTLGSDWRPGPGATAQRPTLLPHLPHLRPWLAKLMRCTQQPQRSTQHPAQQPVQQLMQQPTRRGLELQAQHQRGM